MNKIKIFRYSSIIFIILFTFPLLRGYFLVTDYIYLFAYPLSCLLLFPKAFYNKSSLFLLAYLLIYLLVYSDNKKYDIIYTLSEFLSFLSAITIINICLYNKDFRSFYIIFRNSLIILIVTLLISIPLLLENSELVRDMVMLSDDIDQFRFLQRSGIVSYGTIHSLPIVFPILICHLKYTRRIKVKFFVIFLIILFLFIIINSATTTPLILSVIGIIVGFLIQKNNKKTLIMMAFLSVFYFIVSSKEILISILDAVYPFFSDNSIGEKIVDFQTLIKYGEVTGQIEGREELYNTSWETFYNHPLTGSSLYQDTGGHAYFVDKLAYLGVLGTLPFFLFFYYQLKSIYKVLHPAVRFYYLTGIILFFSLGFTKNIGGFDYWFFLFLLLPGFCFFTFNSFLKSKSQYIKSN